MMLNALYSIVAGILAGAVPHLVFRMMFFKPFGLEAKKFIKNFYWAGIFKFGTVVALLTLGFSLPRLKKELLIGTFIITQLLFVGLNFFTRERGCCFK